MFGGAGLYVGDVMFGLVSEGRIYLTADAETMSAFKRENCAPFQYNTKHGRRAAMSYWELPERLYDDAGELAQWAKLALRIAREAVVARSSKRPRKSRKAAKIKGEA